MGRTATPEPFAVEFGARVRRHRQAREWTQEQLAEAAAMHWTYVGSVERGERNISLHNILRLASALGLDASDLLRGLRLD